MKVDRGLILAAVIAVVLGVTACSVDTFMPKGPEEQPPEEIDEGGTTEGEPEIAPSVTIGESPTAADSMDGMFREWENSHSQYERGLFTPEEFEPRIERWRLNMAFPGFQEVWEATRMTFAPSFRAEIDRIVAEVGG